jgi:hypothetical protein
MGHSIHHKYDIKSWFVAVTESKGKKPCLDRGGGDGGGGMICTMMEAAEGMPYHQLLWQGLLSY